jgi:hypothetical protein
MAGFQVFARPLRATGLRHASVVDSIEMKAFLRAFLILLVSVSVPAQEATPAPEVHSSDLGFLYSLPADWQVVDLKTPPAEENTPQQNAQPDDQRKGIACVDVALTARQGNPPSVIVVVDLPLLCFGQSMTAKDLPSFAQGASEEFKRSFDLNLPITQNYKLGSHSMWVERVKGKPKGHPEASPYTVEIACTLLQKGAVCWMGLISNDEALKAFETGPVKLEDDPPTVLVPARVFGKNP